MAANLWFRPVCDDLLVKILRWLMEYEKGEVYSTRDFLTVDGHRVDRPTRYASRIPLKPLEVQNLVSIMSALAPDNPLTADLKVLQQGMARRFTNMPLVNRP